MSTPLWTPNIPTRTIPDTVTEPEPGRRLAPDKLCDGQKARVVKRIVRELP